MCATGSSVVCVCMLASSQRLSDVCGRGWTPTFSEKEPNAAQCQSASSAAAGMGAKSALELVSTDGLSVEGNKTPPLIEAKFLKW